MSAIVKTLSVDSDIVLIRKHIVNLVKTTSQQNAGEFHSCMNISRRRHRGRTNHVVSAFGASFHSPLPRFAVSIDFSSSMSMAGRRVCSMA
ncbi:protein of unknown function [Burkholderia multivorans]